MGFPVGGIKCGSCGSHWIEAESIMDYFFAVKCVPCGLNGTSYYSELEAERLRVVNIGGYK